MNGDLVLVLGIVLIALGAAGALVTLLFLIWMFGPGAMVVAAGFAIVAVVGALMVGVAA